MKSYTPIHVENMPEAKVSKIAWKIDLVVSNVAT